MITSPFQPAPISAQRKRVLFPALILFALSFILVKVAANSSALFGAKFDESTLGFYRSLIHDSTHVPEVCSEGDGRSVVQKAVCGDFYEKLYLRVGVGLIPLVVVLVFFEVMKALLRRIYGGAEVRFSQDAMMFSGVVTEPTFVTPDWFAKTFCFKCVSVQIAGREQLVIHIPDESGDPRPGEALGVYEQLHWLGHKINIGAKHTPHVAVISGRS